MANLCRKFLTLTFQAFVLFACAMVWFFMIAIPISLYGVL